MAASDKALPSLRIGITIGIKQEAEGMWNNGIKQNALALMQMLKLSPSRHNVCLVNTTEINITHEIGWALDEFPTFSLAQKIAQLDVLIVLGGAITAETIDQIHANGGKVIGYKCGVEYVMSMQASMFNHAIPGHPLYPTNYDAMWAIPQVANISRSYWQVLHRIRVDTVPFVWDPRWLTQFAATLPNNAKAIAHNRPKRISIFEPNQDVVKYCLYPLMIAELAFRARPDLIELVSVTNTQTLRKNSEFVGVVQHLDLARQHKVFFEDRFITPWFLAHHTDVVVAHQWQNPLNYAYLEYGWLGYPLVHNAEMIADQGYFYAGFDVEAGAQKLIEALLASETNAIDAHENYHEKQKKLIAQFLSTEKKNSQRYDELLGDVVNAATFTTPLHNET